MAKARSAKRCEHLTTAEVLRYRPKAANRATVRAHYAKWREQKALSARCDITDCQFYVSGLLWRGHPLPLILDHMNGNSLDNSPENLRYLCPNCDSQMLTRGGKNRGRVIRAIEGLYELRPRGDGNDGGIFLFAKVGQFGWSGIPGTITTPVATSQAGPHKEDN